MKNRITQGKLTGSLVAVAIFAAMAPAVNAATDTANSQLTQSITAGTLTTDFRDGSNNVIASGAFSMTPAAVSTVQQTVTGSFGTSTQRISVDNPDASDGGWSLAIAAANVADVWTSGGNTYDFNGSSAAGQMTLDPSVSTLTSVVGTSTGLTKGSSASFVSGTADSITLLTAAAGADDIWNGYLTGVAVSQTVPAATPVGSYTLNLVQTVTSV